MNYKKFFLASISFLLLNVQIIKSKKFEDYKNAPDQNEQAEQRQNRPRINGAPRNNNDGAQRARNNLHRPVFEGARRGGRRRHNVRYLLARQAREQNNVIAPQQNQIINQQRQERQRENQYHVALREQDLRNILQRERAERLQQEREIREALHNQRLAQAHAAGIARQLFVNDEDDN